MHLAQTISDHVLQVLKLLVYVSRAGRENWTEVITQHSYGAFSHELGIASSHTSDF